MLFPLQKPELYCTTLWSIYWICDLLPQYPHGTSRPQEADERRPLLRAARHRENDAGQGACETIGVLLPEHHCFYNHEQVSIAYEIKSIAQFSYLSLRCDQLCCCWQVAGRRLSSGACRVHSGPEAGALHHLHRRGGRDAGQEGNGRARSVAAGSAAVRGEQMWGMCGARTRSRALFHQVRPLTFKI